MAISLKHNFQSAVADGGDTSLVQPSNWNAEHNLTMDTNKLLGRSTAGTGAAEEISVGTNLSLSGGTLSVSGLGTIATQDANNVAITGGSITGITDLAVADGGTGKSSFTAYSVLLGGTTSTGALQNVSGLGTSGQVLTSAGSSAVPTWSDVPNGLTLIQTDTFNASGTYAVPDAADVFKAHIWGAGGSGGCGSGNAPAGGGGGGGFLEVFFTRINLGSNTTLSVTVGAGGAARSTANTAGAAGGTSSIGGGTGNYNNFTAFGGGGGGQAAAGGGGGGGGGSGNGSAGGTAAGTVAGTAGSGGSTNAANNIVPDGNSITFTRVTYGTAAAPTVAANIQAVNSTNWGTRVGTGVVGATGNTNTNTSQDTTGGNDRIDPTAQVIYGGAGGGSGRDQAGSATANRGGNAAYGGGGGGGAAQSVAGGNGGTSTYGGAGGAGSIDTAAAGNGVQPGGGGGGSEGGTSGAGGDGRVIIYAYRFNG